MELTPMLDRTSDEPLYMQLYRYTRSRMENGTIEAGERLPSIRALSMHLHISKITVEAAYQQLIAEGYVESRERSGLRALPVERAPQAAALLGGMEGMHAAARHAWSQAAVVAQQQSREAASHTCGANTSGDGSAVGAETEVPPPQRSIDFDFQYGHIELERFPIKAWRSAMQTALEYELHEVFGYGHSQGDEGLRAEIARYLAQSRGVNCRPEQIIMTAGTQQALSLLCRLLPLAGRTVAMEEPGYHGARTMLADHGCMLLPVPVEADGISVSALSAYGSGISAVYVTPSHQFPLGGVLTVHNRQQLLQWASECGAYILEDDYDSEFRYQGQPIPALQALDREGRVIYLGTLSKSFLPGVRMSYIVMPEALTGPSMRKQLALYSSPVSPLLQRAVRHFMQEGHMERHVRRMRRLYQAKHRQLIQSIQAHMGNRVTIIGQKAGLHLLLDVHGRNRSELMALAEAEGIRVYSPAEQWANPMACPDSLLILGFGGLQERTIDEAVRRLAGCWFGL
ncbi:PLP-dependent aminotransferase family protein [Paenibacillus sp. PR3]|uniref:PLP-dependent aminotransferase family protein n=1 Tax=Paenibacillus terricola TaxID=2763503 RepID=A0ABR8MXA4_9BACL|nr:PLP-dependent aminotransferase family protein [Paenibacillus terricola]MBD3920604.1 PLP-dependent aminotransferase family protein [Paenibacillus terricola]